MQMVPGQAFLLGASAVDGGARVGKSWEVIDGRQFLVEEVPAKALANALSTLPMSQTASTRSIQKKMLCIASRKYLLPAKHLAKVNTNKQIIREASILQKKGLVLDYRTFSGSTNNVTFQGDTTYYISGSFGVTGIATFEGGSVIKYPTNSGSIIINNSAGINSETTIYDPVILTAADDNSVGEQISGSTGNPTSYYGQKTAGYISLGGESAGNDIWLTGFHFRYAQTGIGANGPPARAIAKLYDGQFVNCQCAINANMATYSIYNVLFANIQTNFASFTLNTLTNLNAQNSTFVNVTNISSFLTTQRPLLNFTNCIFANIVKITNMPNATVNGANNGFYRSPTCGVSTFTNTSYPFQTVGAANYYLTNGFRGVGTTNIDNLLSAYLEEKTTYPPLVYSNISDF